MLVNVQLTFVHLDADSMEEEVEFNWEEYLEENGADAAPHTNFKHVSDCLQTSPDMLIL